MPTALQPAPASKAMSPAASQMRAALQSLQDKPADDIGTIMKREWQSSIQRANRICRDERSVLPRYFFTDFINFARATAEEDFRAGNIDAAQAVEKLVDRLAETLAAY